MPKSEQVQEAQGGQKAAESIQQAADESASALSTESASAPGAINRKQQMLLDFVREFDAATPDCPVCGYNLKALTRPTCPECGQELVLTIGAARHPIGWLLASLAPGFFSGIAAFLLLIPITAMRLTVGRNEPLILALDLFGWCSGVFAIILATKRSRFLAKSRKWQQRFAIIMWVIHISALALFILIGVLFN